MCLFLFTHAYIYIYIESIPGPLTVNKCFLYLIYIKPGAQENYRIWAYFLVLIFVLRIVFLVLQIVRHGHNREHKKEHKNGQKKYTREHKKIIAFGLVFSCSCLCFGLWFSCSGLCAMSTVGSTRKSTRMARKSTLGSTRKLSHLGLFSRAHFCALDCGSRAPDCVPR